MRGEGGGDLIVAAVPRRVTAVAVGRGHPPSVSEPTAATGEEGMGDDGRDGGGGGGGSCDGLLVPRSGGTYRSASTAS